MARQLLIYLGPAAPAEVQWATTTASGRLNCGSGPLAEVPRAAGERLVVLVPGAEVLVSEVAIPGGRKRLVRQSLPFLLEENLAAEVEDLHFAVGPTSSTGQMAVAAVARVRLGGWLSMLHGAGLQPAVLTPATLAVPISADGWTLLLTDEGFLARLGNWRAFGGESANLGHYLRGETAGVAQVFNCTGKETAPPAIGMELPPARPAQFIKLLAEGHAATPGINLLQGEFAGSARWREGLRRWRVALAAGVLLALLTGVDATLDYLRLCQEAARLDQEITSTFRQALPDSHRIVNARAQMEQRLKELHDNSRQDNFFALYDKVAPLLAATPNPGLEVFRFHDGRLELDLNLARPEELEKLKGDLAKAPGIGLEVRNVETSGGRLRARLALEVKS